MSHVIQWNLAAEFERISSLKFSSPQNFQIPTVINCLNIMLLLFTTFRYLPNFIFSRNTAHLMISQKNNVIWAVSTISPTGYNIIWYACDERKLFFPFRFEGCLSAGCSGQFGTFYFLLNRTDWSWRFSMFIFFEYFWKDLYMSKNVVSKIEPIISSCFLYLQKKIINKLLRSIL